MITKPSGDNRWLFYAKRRIIDEELIVNGELVFERNNKLKVGSLIAISENLRHGVAENLLEIAEAGLNTEELFLTRLVHLHYLAHS